MAEPHARIDGVDASASLRTSAVEHVGAGEPAASADKAPEFGRRYMFYGLGLLLGVAVFNLIDRSIINLLLVPIGQDLHLSDTQLGAFAGPVFALFYAAAQIPIARFADRGRRGRVIALALAFWSAMTTMQSFAIGFLTLAIARAGVAIGEAGAGPASQSVIADLFPPTMRTRAFAVFAFQAPVGVAIGYFIGGWGRQLLGWHHTLLLVGLPGLVLASVVWFTFREPTRGYWQPRIVEHTASLAETFKFLLGLPALRHLVAGYSVTVIVAGAQSFDVVYLERSFHLSASQIGSLVGAAGLLAMIGYYFGGWLSDRYSIRDPAWAMRLPAIFLLIHLSFACIYYFTPAAPVAITVALVAPFLPATLPLVFANAQSLAPAHMRARAGALWLTVSTLVGMGIGPQLAGFLSDMLKPTFGEESMRYTLISIVAVGYLWSATHYWLGSRTLTRDLRAKDVFG